MRVKYFSPDSKYHNLSCRCRQGHGHDSRFEASYCNQLELLKRSREIKDYRCQIAFELRVGERLIATHYVDFLVTDINGNQEIHETKGPETEIWRLKKKLCEVLYPQIPYIVIKKGGWYGGKTGRKKSRRARKRIG